MEGWRNLGCWTLRGVRDAGPVRALAGFVSMVASAWFGVLAGQTYYYGWEKFNERPVHKLLGPLAPIAYVAEFGPQIIAYGVLPSVLLHRSLKTRLQHLEDIFNDVFRDLKDQGIDKHQLAHLHRMLGEQVRASRSSLWADCKFSSESIRLLNESQGLTDDEIDGALIGVYEAVREDYDREIAGLVNAIYWMFKA